jgi:ribosomal-protein-alanine N-acetyltransferase
MTTAAISGAAPRDRAGAYDPASDATGRVLPPAFRPVIETARLVLRPPTLQDIDDVVRAIGDLAVSRNLARVPHPYTRENAQSYVLFAARGAALRRSLISAIALDGRLIGVVSIDAIPARNRVGYWLARDHWGRGFASEAVGAAAAYAFQVLGLRLLRAGVFVDNPASLHVLVKLGFRPIGRRNSRSLARDEPLQHIATVLTRARFLSRKP